MQTKFKTSKYKPGKLELWSSIDKQGRVNLIMIEADGTAEFMYSTGDWDVTHAEPEDSCWPTPFEFLGYL